MNNISRRRVMGGKAELLPYLRFTALEDGTFKHNTDALEYSLDNGNTWVALAANTDSPTVTAGNSILWRGTMSPRNKNQWFSSTGRFDASGNPLCLKYKDAFVGAAPVDYEFFRLFQNCAIVNAKDIVIPSNLSGKTHICMRMFEGCTSLLTTPELPATTLTTNCYSYMFSGCTSLTTAPELPATNLGSSCYGHMFYGCTSLTTAPTLSVTTLANNCYENMFEGCTSLTTAPELPATTLTRSCYSSMFTNCTSLVNIPDLPATTLEQLCYYFMFSGCTSLTSTPVMSPTTLASQCCQRMFSGCTNLQNVLLTLPATTVIDRCYFAMFYDCKKITTAPVLPAVTLESNCYGMMFRGCKLLIYVKAMFTTTPSTTYTNNWLIGVSSTGTFVKNSVATWDVRGSHGIPNDWTVQTASS